MCCLKKIGADDWEEKHLLFFGRCSKKLLWRWYSYCLLKMDLVLLCFIYSTLKKNNKTKQNKTRNCFTLYIDFLKDSNFFNTYLLKKSQCSVLNSVKKTVAYIFIHWHLIYPLVCYNNNNFKFCIHFHWFIIPSRWDA